MRGTYNGSLQLWALQRSNAHTITICEYAEQENLVWCPFSQFSHLLCVCMPSQSPVKTYSSFVWASPWQTCPDKAGSNNPANIEGWLNPSLGSIGQLKAVRWNISISFLRHWNSLLEYLKQGVNRAISSMASNLWVSFCTWRGLE